MRIEPIGVEYRTTDHFPIAPILTEPPEQDRTAAEAEVTSLYYVTTLQSMQATSTEGAPTPASAALAVERQPSEKSLLARAGDWMWGAAQAFWNQITSIFQSNTTTEKGQLQAEQPVGVPLDHIPKLSPPEVEQQRKLTERILELNRELTRSFKEIADFEEELQKSNSHNMDRLVFVHLIASSLEQKKLREEGGVNVQEETLELHEKNKKLHVALYDLIDEACKHAHAEKVVHWVQIGSHVASLATFAIAAFLLGPASALGVAIPLSSISSGILRLTQDHFQAQVNTATGNITVTKHDMSANGTAIEGKLEDLQGVTQDIGSILKAVRLLIEKQGQAERANFDRK